MDKYYCSYQHIHRIIRKSAQEIIASGFEPDFILAIGGGGFIPARIMRTFINKPIISISVAYYDESDKPTDAPKKYQWLDEAHVDISGKKILMVDEVDDSRVTLEYCLDELLAQNNPAEIVVFVLHNKNKPKRGKYPESIKRIYVGEETEDKWIVYPWDAEDIDAHDKLAGNG